MVPIGIDNIADQRSLCPLRRPGRSPRRRNSTTVRPTTITRQRHAQREEGASVADVGDHPVEIHAEEADHEVIAEKITETSVSRLIWSL